MVSFSRVGAVRRNHSPSRLEMVVMAGLLLVVLAARSYAATIEIHPGTNVFGPAAQSLVAGDTLIVHQGTYSETTRMSIQVQGTATQPILIKGADGEARPIITRPASASVQNTINIEGSARYLTIKGLEIVGNGGDGIAPNGALSYITLEDLVIHDVDVGIGMHTNMDHISIRNNHIYRTGTNGGTGEGMYVGCHDGSCIVHDSVIENNWIHDVLPGTTQGDGIEVKVGSYGNIIRNNVIYNRTYPGIFVYGTGVNPVNIVEGNVVWNSLEGIYAVADAIVRNNIVFNSGTGLSLYGHSQVAQMKNVTAVNNTLYNNDDGIYIRWGGTNMTLANNAIYSPGKTAVNSSFGVQGTVRSNYVEGFMNADPIDNLKFFAGGSANSAFANPTGSDFWLTATSVLRSTANASYVPTIDFNGTARTSPYDVGAYETQGLATNPGWKITTGFKASGGPPPPPPPADTTPPSVPTGLLATPVSSSQITLSWTASTDTVGVTGYRVFRGGVQIATVATTTYTDTGLVASTAYSYTVAAHDAAANVSAQSVAVSATTLAGTGFPTNPRLSALPTNTALDLGPYTCVTQPGDISCKGIVSYSGFAYDSQHHQILMFGGGHAATFRDDVDVFNFGSLTWNSAYPPTPCSEMIQSNVQANGTWRTTGHPISRHTYDQLVYAPNVDRLIITVEASNSFNTGSGGCVSITNPGNAMHHYNSTTRTWTPSASAALPYALAAEYDPVSGMIISLGGGYGGGGLWTYNPITQVSTHWSVNAPVTDYADNLVYFPPNDKMYYIERGTNVYEITLNRTNWAASTVVRVTGMVGGPSSEETGYTYDSVNRIIGGGITNGVFYAYNPLTKTWTTRTMPVQSSAGATPGTTNAYHTVAYDPVDNVFIFLSSGNQGLRTWAYRYAGGAPPAGTTTPPSAPTGLLVE